MNKTCSAATTLSSAFFALGFLASCPAQASKMDTGGKWITPDFYVSAHASLSTVHFDAATTDCRAHIAEAMCLVDPLDPNDPDSLEKRPCLPGGELYAGRLEQIHDALPPTIQKTFCSLKKILIEKQLNSTAYGGMLPGGAIVGIRQSLLDAHMSFGKWASWKEQLSFGGRNDVYEPVADLPTFTIAGSTGVDNFLYQLMVHEFGHILDFANDLNLAEDCALPSPERPYPECEFAAGTWGTLSWITTEKPRPAQDFFDRLSLCFYYCDGKIADRTRANRLYGDLYATSFINGYAATNPWDDFADSLAYYNFKHELNGSIRLSTQQGMSFDLAEKIDLPQFAAKKAFIERFLARTDLKYPELH